MDTFYQVVDATTTSANLSYTHWITKELFSTSWVVITIALAMSLLLLSIIDKRRLMEIVLFGCLLTFLFGYTDVVATEYSLWEFKSRILPVKSSVFPFSYAMNPILHMLAFQYGQTWRSFALLNAIVAAFFAFIAHPFYVWVDVLWIGKWNYLNSFIYLMAVPFGVRAFVIWLANIEQEHAAGCKTPLISSLHPVMKLLDDDKDKDR